MASPKHLNQGQKRGQHGDEIGSLDVPIIVSNMGLQRLRRTPIPKAQHAIIADTASNIQDNTNEKYLMLVTC
jgi:hypothetical protein